MSCDIHTAETDPNSLKTPAQIVGQIVAAQDHPNPIEGQDIINKLCWGCKLDGQESAFDTAKNITRAKVDCSTCPLFTS